MQKVACDIDGCLADFNLDYGRLFIELTGENRFPPDWEECLAANTFPEVWNWESQAGYTPEQVRKVWREITHNDGFWSGLGELPGAREAIRKLNHMANLGHDIYFITNRMGTRAKHQTEIWLYSLGMNYPTVLVAADKLPILKSLGIGVFIDDKPETIQEIDEDYFGESNVKMIKPNLKLYLRDAPYNRTQTYSEDVRRVPGVLEALKDACGV